MSSLRGALNKDKKLQREDSLYNVPRDNRYKNRMYHIYSDIVEMDKKHSPGNIPPREVPYYYSIVGSGLRGGEEKKDDEYLKEFTKLLKGNKGQVEELRSKLQGVDIHDDPVARGVYQKLLRVVDQDDYNSCLGRYSPYYDIPPKNIENQIGLSKNRKLRNDIYEKVDRNRVHRGQNHRHGSGLAASGNSTELFTRHLAKMRNQDIPSSYPTKKAYNLFTFI